jgi:hypothetical protein
VAPHRVWLAFLDERHTVWSAASSAHAAVLRRMADAAVATPAHLSDERSSLAARCELLRWCLRFAESGGAGGATSLMTLARRERVYHAALGWFASPPAWRVPENRAAAERDVAALAAFADAIERDTIFAGVGSGDRAGRRSMGGLASSSGSTGATGSTSGGGGGGGGGGSLSGSGVLDVRGGMPLSPTRDAGSAAIDESDVAAALKSLHQMQQLILLLLGHEIDRYVTWANPLSRPERAFADTERHTARHRRATAKDWRAHVSAAWRVSPRVALRLADRFPHVAPLRDLLATRLSLAGIGRASSDGLAVLRAVELIRDGLSGAAAGVDPLRELVYI